MLNEEKLSQKFLRRGFWLYFFTFISAPLGYIIKIILSHDLSVEEVGLFYGIISIITLLGAMNDLGGTESLNYFLPKYIIKKEYGKVKYLLSLVGKLQIASSIIIIAILYFLSGFLAENYFHNTQARELLIIFSLFFLGGNLTHICTTLFSATQNTKLQKATEFSRIFATTIFTIGLFILNEGEIIRYAYIWIVGVVIAMIFAGFFAFKNYYIPYLKNIEIVPDIQLRNSFIKYAIPTFLTANISLILSQIDAQLVIGFLGNTDHGYYSNYLSIMTLPFIVLSPIIGFLFPVFTELHTRGQKEKISLLFHNMFMILCVLSIWVSFFLFQSGDELAKILFGDKFIISGEILQYSTPFLIFNILNQLNFQLLAGIGKAWTRTISFAIVLPINIILNIIFIPLLGVHGSALAVGLSWIPLYSITAYATKSYFSHPKWSIILVNFFASIVSFSCIYLLKKNFSLPIMAQLGIIIGIYGFMFLVINFTYFKKIYKNFTIHRS